MLKIAVIGAGVVGLSTAINIQKLLPTAVVTIIADKFTKATTSHGAGGLFRPNAEHILGVDPTLIKRWSVSAFKYYSSLATSQEARDSGHMIMPGYVFSNTEVKNPLYKELVFSFRELTSAELQKMGVDYKYGYQVTTVITDMTRYLPWLMIRFKGAGGLVTNKTIDTLEEFVGHYDAVVNCAGFRSRELVGDKTVYPVRGHLITVKAPWVKNWVYTEDQTYFVPRFDTISLGGLRQKDNYSKEIVPGEREAILQRCYKLWPSLKGAEIISDWVDLRPHRDPVRVEREVMKFNKGSLKVIHNYGHGANGVTLSWGTSLDAAKLAAAAVMEAKSKL